MNKTFWIFTITTLLVILVLLVSINRKTKNDNQNINIQPQALEFTPIKPIIEQLDESYKEWFYPPLDFPQHEKLKNKIFCSWKTLHFATVTNNQKLTQTAHLIFQADLNELLGIFGTRGHFWIGEFLFQNQHNFPENCIPLNNFIAPYINAFIQNDFEKIALFENWLTPEKQIKIDQKPIVHLLFRKLYTQATTIIAQQRLLPPIEELAIIRWQIEVSNLPIELKRDFINRQKLRQPKLYDYEYASAVLEYKHANFEKAADILLIALQKAETNKDYNKINKYLAALNFLEQSNLINP